MWCHVYDYDTFVLQDGDDESPVLQEWQRVRQDKFNFEKLWRQLIKDLINDLMI